MERFKIGHIDQIDEATLTKMEEEVFNNPKAVKYLRQLGLSDEAIKNNITKIYDFAVDMNNCRGCKGIKYCNKEPKYLVTSVTYKKGIVDRNIIPCKKYLEYTNFKRKFIVYDFEEEWLNNSITSVNNLASKPKQEILAVFKEVCTKNSNKWIFIKSGIATGKSYYAATLASVGARQNFFNSIAFINVPDRFKELADLAFSKNPKFAEDIEKYKNVEFLVLDDFGNEFKSDFVRDNILYPILSHRVRNKLFTIITSNYSIDDCANMYQTNNASKPKIEQIRQMLNLMCNKEITLLDPSLQ